MFVEYAKASPEDILIRITVHNRGPEAAELHVLPTLWFRNDWASVDRDQTRRETACSSRSTDRRARARLRRRIPCWGRTICTAKAMRRCSSPRTQPTTPSSASTTRTTGPYLKDGINDYVVQGRQDAVNPERRGTKAAAHYRLHGRPRPVGDGAAAPDRPRSGRAAQADKGRAAPSGRLRRDPGRPAAGGGRVLPLGDPALGLAGCGQRDAPGPRRHALVQAVLLLRRRCVAGGAPRPSPPSRQPRLPEPRVVPHDQRRHHLDARQVGVPLVRRLGPRLPHAAARRSWTPTSPSSSWS